MTKYDLVDYLANLHFLLEGQEKTGIEKSRTLLREYNRAWDELKQLIKDEEDETRQSES